MDAFYSGSKEHSQSMIAYFAKNMLFRTDSLGSSKHHPEQRAFTISVLSKNEKNNLSYDIAVIQWITSCYK